MSDSPASRDVAAVAAAATAVAGAVGVQWRRAATHAHDLEVMAELARVTSQKKDARAEVGEAALELLKGDAILHFLAYGAVLRVEVTNGLPVPRLQIPVDDPESAAARAFRAQEMTFVNSGGSTELEALRDIGAKAILAMPVSRGDRRYGVMAWVWRRRKRRLSAHERRLAEMLTAEKGIVFERAQLFQEAEELTRSQVRTRLARDLHDSVAQELAVLRTYSDTATKALGDRPENAVARPQALAEVLTLMDAHIDKAHGEMRELLDALRSEHPLVELGLADILHSLVAEFRVRRPDVEVHMDASHDLPAELRPDVRETVYFILREALHNIARHAGPTTVGVELRAGPECLLLVVGDDGRGFDPATAARRRHGLAGMQERAKLAGGDLEITSAPGEGTTVRLRIPDPSGHERRRPSTN
jgi:signal transduction histidine kinase